MTYKLDRSAFRWHAAKEASTQYNYWKAQPLEERLKAAFYLNSVAFNFDINNPPKMDKTYFRIRSRK